MYEMFYTGIGYPSVAEILSEVRGKFKYWYWASDECLGFSAMYNGDTVVVFNDFEGMNDPMIADAKKYGKEIK